jgi:uncharacterized membrane protein YtjA (UPF0391 family)
MDGRFEVRVASGAWSAMSLRVRAMLNWAVMFLIIAIIAAVLGFGGVAGTAAWMAKVLFVVFLVLFVVSLISGRRGTLP